MRVSWTRHAIDQMAAIEAYIARDNPAAAERHIDLLFERAESLTAFPLRGRRIAERTDAGLRELIVRGYRLIYRVLEEDTIEVVTVLEGHRLLRDDEVEG